MHRACGPPLVNAFRTAGEHDAASRRQLDWQHRLMEHLPSVMKVSANSKPVGAVQERLRAGC